MIQYQLDQGGFAAAVGSYDHHAVILFKRKRHVREDLLLSKAHTQSLDGQHVVTAGQGCGKAHFDRLGRTLGLCHALNFGKQLLTRTDGYVVVRLIPATLLVQERLLARKFTLLQIVFLLLQCSVLLAHLHGLRIVPLVQLGVAILHHQGLARHAVKEIAVVRDDHDALFIGDEKALQPRKRFHIKVVGGLVQK